MAAPGDPRLPRLASRTVAAEPGYGARSLPIWTATASPATSISAVQNWLIWDTYQRKRITARHI
jgi:hypothetical protein